VILPLYCFVDYKGDYAITSPGRRSNVRFNARDEQEEASLELFDGKNVILTPNDSGKM
jgi:hypothetical protein